MLDFPPSRRPEPGGLTVSAEQRARVDVEHPKRVATDSMSEDFRPDIPPAVTESADDAEALAAREQSREADPDATAAWSPEHDPDATAAWSPEHDPDATAAWSPEHAVNGSHDAEAYDAAAAWAGQRPTNGHRELEPDLDSAAAWDPSDVDEAQAPSGPVPAASEPRARRERPRFPPRPPAHLPRRDRRGGAAHRARGHDAHATGNGAGGEPPFPGASGLPPEDELPPLRGRTRLKRLRFFAILIAGLILGLISFVFGMFMAVASDVSGLEKSVADSARFNKAANSVLYDDHGRQLATLTNHNDVLLQPDQVPALVSEAVISVEDKRFYTNSGIDFRGIARALVQDLLHQHAVQGASTIEQQFVKNVVQAQSHRTIFEKLREAALAYHLDHRWSKKQILAEYLNTIYFGEGAYGIESAAQTLFGHDPNHLGCGSEKNLCVTNLYPWEAALLAGIIASPTAYDPVTHPAAARARRNQVLTDMYQQGYISLTEYREGLSAALPGPSEVQPPQLESEQSSTGYFDSWVQQQLIAAYGVTKALDGGLKVRTSLDLNLQHDAVNAINGYLANPAGPTASLVAIDNRTGQVRAMVGGRDFNQSQFNLATEGERQPGSAWKAFDLAAALSVGISPDSVWPSHIVSFRVGHTSEIFTVHNDEGAYTGSNTLAGATADSDNTIFAQVGLSKQVGTERIKHYAHYMGINTPISTNDAMTIGGLSRGVTVLDMAHAYETIAEGGDRISGSLVPTNAPVGIVDVKFPDGSEQRDKLRRRRVLSKSVASTETTMLEGVIDHGTGTAAAIGTFAAGKTGTTSNYGDAWFVGWNSKYTVAVWVGYPNRLVPMTTQFNGTPVLGGTFPALIWHDFMLSAMNSGVPVAPTGTTTVTGASGVSGPVTAASTGTSSASGATPTTASGTSGPATNGGSASSPAQSTTTPQTNAPRTDTGAGTSPGGATSSPTGGVGAPQG
jgi:penicillin-binding protein 1A